MSSFFFQSAPLQTILTRYDTINYLIFDDIGSILNMIIYSSYNTDPSISSLFYCKAYISIFRYFSGQIMRTFIIIAGMNRYAAFNKRAFFTCFSRYQIAVRTIPCVIIFWLLFSLFPSALQSIENNICDIFGLTNACIFSIYTTRVPV
ncbi:hypothetical protein I4U23_019790 [Adineta vaga]|nr:hypothetical protein I4U23_019790 [Adineta vaga]